MHDGNSANLPDVVSQRHRPFVDRVSRVLKATLADLRTTMLAAAAMTLLFQVSCMDLSREALHKGRIHEGDSYTWQALVEGWWDTGEWSPRVLSHNAPYGLETHLTRPFAAVVLGLAQPLGLYLSRRDATRVAGKLSGPVLHVLTAVTVAWGAGALLGPGGALLAVFGFLLMLLSRVRFGVLAFDHHALHLFLTALTMALLLRHAVGSGRRGCLAGVAGGVAGVGIWSGVELLIPAGIGGVALGLAWVARGGQSRARGLWLYTLGMAMALTLALVLERPPQEWGVALDRISGTHVLLGSLSAGSAGMIGWLQKHRSNIASAQRFGAVAFVSGGAAVVMWAMVPDFFLGYYGTFDSVVHEHHWRGLPGSSGAVVRFAAAPGLLGYYLCLVSLVAFGTWWGLRVPLKREAWMVVAVGASVGATFAFPHFRLVQYHEVFASIGLGGAAAGLGRLVWRKAPAGLRFAGVPLALFVVMFPYVGLLVGHRLGQDSVHPFLQNLWQGGDCDWSALGRAVARLPGEPRGNIVTYANAGPELTDMSGARCCGDRMSLQRRGHAGRPRHSAVYIGCRTGRGGASGSGIRGAMSIRSRLAGSRLVHRAVRPGRHLRAVSAGGSARLASPSVRVRARGRGFYRAPDGVHCARPCKSRARNRRMIRPPMPMSFQADLWLDRFDTKSA